MSAYDRYQRALDRLYAALVVRQLTQLEAQRLIVYEMRLLGLDVR